MDLFPGGEMMNEKEKKRDLITQMVDGIAKRPEDAKTPAEKNRMEEQRKRSLERVFVRRCQRD